MESKAVPFSGRHDLDTFRFRKTIAMGHTFILLIIFTPPLIFCTILGQNLDGIYFAGRKLWLVIIILFLFGICFPFLHVFLAPKRSTRLILPSVWLPCALILLSCSAYQWNTEHAETALFNRDCYAFETKRDLNRAYQVAEEIYDACVLLPGLAIEGVSVGDCPQYAVAKEKWGLQFRYLESLEQRFHCAGVCRSQTSKRLWFDAGMPAPSCALFAIQWLHLATVQTKIIIGYCLIVAIAVLPARQALLIPLVQHLEKQTDLEDA